MTETEVTAIEQRTRLFAASDMVRDVANSTDSPEQYEGELRDIGNRLIVIGRQITADLKTRKAPKEKP